jgi:hypothetical protein
VSGQVTDGELRGIEQLESKGVPGTDPVLRKHNGEPFDALNTTSPMWQGWSVTYTDSAIRLP